MTDSEIVSKTIQFVKETLADAEGGHDWFHIQRVYNNTLRLAEEEQVDNLVVRLGALLHDIADSKFHNGDETIGPKVAADFLASLNVDKATSEHVINIIENISFKSSLEALSSNKKFASKELEVVQDADRLDAIGAIGIARAFNYGGFKNRQLYNPEIAPEPNMTKEAYKKATGPTINHFYEKLLLLKDRMNTSTGKKLAQKRHQYMLDYLNQFDNEWNGLL
ncbi:HD domain-containing protein [Maribacter sp. 2307UL18-2]|uniref:HD domain-containing protein n=1 Tax=Maribacter sp. 2307UL18-2 TaxID=3386274 RepID=UPI0039BC2F3F